jgi:hypothetical protein
MKSLNINTIATLTTAALVAGDALFDSCTALQTEFKGCDKETVKSTMLPLVAKHYGLTTKVQGTGRVVMQGEETAVNTATRKLNRLVAAITATVADKTELDVPADILEAAAKLWALCAEYKEANKLCATALATAKAK